MSDGIPAEAERLLGLDPEEFVPERGRLVKELRQEGRAEEAATVAELRKPTAVVLAVNRAARARPKAARAAAGAAVEVRRTQLGGDRTVYAKARDELDESLSLLTEVALAHIAPRGKPSEAMRRRLQDLLRNAVANDEAREELVRGVLRQEVEPAGFASMAAAVPPGGAKRRAAPAIGAKEARAAERRRQREQELRAALTQAEARLQDTERSLRDAKRERAAAERAVAAIRTKLERL